MGGTRYHNTQVLQDQIQFVTKMEGYAAAIAGLIIGVAFIAAFSVFQQNSSQLADERRIKSASNLQEVKLFQSKYPDGVTRIDHNYDPETGKEITSIAYHYEKRVYDAVAKQDRTKGIVLVVTVDDGAKPTEIRANCFTTGGGVGAIGARQGHIAEFIENVKCTG